MKRKPKVIYGTPLRPNAGIQSWYIKQLSSLAVRMCKKAKEEILKVWRRTAYDHALDDSLASQQRIMLNRLNREFEDLFAQKADELAKSMLRRQVRFAQTSVNASVASLAGKTDLTASSLPLYTPKIRELAKASIYDNVTLIKSIQSQYFKQITGAVTRSILDEQGIGYLTQQLSKYEGITKRRARNIAKDQTHKAYEAIAEAKMADAGILEWEWIHGGGTKTVRLSHIRDVKNGGLNHSIHKVGEKAYDPHAKMWIEPGELPYCSCFRRPVIRLA